MKIYLHKNTQEIALDNQMLTNKNTNKEQVIKIQDLSK